MDGYEYATPPLAPVGSSRTSNMLPDRSSLTPVTQTKPLTKHIRFGRTQTPPIAFAAPVFPDTRQLVTELLGLACFP
jgi:hypothetical protein